MNLFAAILALTLSACTTLRNLETAYACRDGQATDECVARYTAEYFRVLDEARKEMERHK